MLKKSEAGCLLDVGRHLGLTVEHAKCIGFCRNCERESACGQRFTYPAALHWYSGRVRLNFQWRYFNVYAYSEAQAIKLLRDAIGYHIKLGVEDFYIQHRRVLSAAEAVGRCCKLKFA